MLNFTYPLTIDSKGASANRKIHITDSTGADVLYSVVNITKAQRKPTQIFADKKRKELRYTLEPTRSKNTIDFQVKVAPMDTFQGSFTFTGSMTSRDFFLNDPVSNPIGKIVSEGVGRELAGQVIGGLVGRGVSGGGAGYLMLLENGTNIALPRVKPRTAQVLAAGEVGSADHWHVILPCLIIWGAYSLT